MSKALAPQQTVTTADVVAANIRAEASRLGFNQVALGKALQMQQTAVSARWRGARPWQLDELDTVATLLGVSVVDLVRKPTHVDFANVYENRPTGDIHQAGGVARSKGLEPPTFWCGVKHLNRLLVCKVA